MPIRRQFSTRTSGAAVAACVVSLLGFGQAAPQGRPAQSNASVSQLFLLYQSRHYAEVTQSLWTASAEPSFPQEVRRASREWPARDAAAFMLEASAAQLRRELASDELRLSLDRGLAPASGVPITRVRQMPADALLFEDGCAAVRRMAHDEEFAKAWHSAAISLLEGSVEAGPFFRMSRGGTLLEKHLPHAEGVISRGALLLASAFPYERRVAALTSYDVPALAGLRVQGDVMLQSQIDGLLRTAFDTAMRRLTDAEAFSDSHLEGALHRAHLLLVLSSQAGYARRALDVVQNLQGHQEGSPSERYLTQLLKGQALAALHDASAARAAFEEAARLQPDSQTAGLWLAILARQQHTNEGPGPHLTAFLTKPERRDDPELIFESAHFTEWTKRLAALRDQLQP